MSGSRPGNYFNKIDNIDMGINGSLKSLTTVSRKYDDLTVHNI